MGGIRGVFITDDAYNNNDDVAGGTNTFENFTLFSQAWVWPDPSGRGGRQIVYEMGVEHGAPTITEEGKWEVNNLGGAGPIVTDIDVNFGEWNHVAVLRGGGSSEFYVNGLLAGVGSGFFGTFVPNTSLGSGEFGEDPFTGLIDNFVLAGTGDLSFNSVNDLDINVTAPPGGCDFDLNGECNQADYDIWSANVGFDNGFGDGDLGTFQLGDGNDDGAVDFFDLRLVIDGARADGNSLSFSGAVPEPTTGLPAGPRRLRSCSNPRPPGLASERRPGPPRRLGRPLDCRTNCLHSTDPNNSRHFGANHHDAVF